MENGLKFMGSICGPGIALFILKASFTPWNVYMFPINEWHHVYLYIYLVAIKIQLNAMLFGVISSKL